MRLILFFLVLLLSFSCKKIKELTYFNIENSTEFTIPSTTGIGIGAIPSVPVQSNSNVDFKSNKTDAKHVEEIKLKELKLSITSPEGQNFNFLNSIEIYISAEGVPEKLLASKNVVPEDVSEFYMETTGEVVDSYIKAESYSLRVKTITDEVLTSDVKIKSDMVFRVRAKVL